MKKDISKENALENEIHHEIENTNANNSTVTNTSETVKTVENKTIETETIKSSELAIIPETTPSVSTNSIITPKENTVINNTSETLAYSSKKKLSDYVITLKILKNQEEKILKFTKRQVICFGMAVTLTCTYTVTAFSQYLINTKQELESNQKALQLVQLEKKHLETVKSTATTPVADTSIQALSEKATELELKINELETIKSNLNEQLEGVSQTAPDELKEAMASCLTVNTSDEAFTPYIKTSYSTDASVSNQLEKVQDLLNKTDLSFTSVATEAIETLSVYTDIPSGSPVEDGIFSSGYDYSGRNGRVHKGIDFSTNSLKLPVVATAFGTIIESSYHSGYGNYVVIDHNNGYKTLYAHNSENHVKIGDTVHKGDVIATTGSTGFSSGIHCHYEVLLDDKHQNPSDYL